MMFPFQISNFLLIHIHYLIQIPCLHLYLIIYHTNEASVTVSYSTGTVAWRARACKTLSDHLAHSTIQCPNLILTLSRKLFLWFHQVIEFPNFFTFFTITAFFHVSAVLRPPERAHRKRGNGSHTSCDSRSVHTCWRRGMWLHHKKSSVRLTRKEQWTSKKLLLRKNTHSIGLSINILTVVKVLFTLSSFPSGQVTALSFTNLKNLATFSHFPSPPRQHRRPCHGRQQGVGREQSVGPYHRQRLLKAEMSRVSRDVGKTPLIFFLPRKQWRNSPFHIVLLQMILHGPGEDGGIASGTESHGIPITPSWCFAGRWCRSRLPIAADVQEQQWDPIHPAAAQAANGSALGIDGIDIRRHSIRLIIRLISRLWSTVTSVWPSHGLLQKGNRTENSSMEFRGIKPETCSFCSFRLVQIDLHRLTHAFCRQWPGTSEEPMDKEVHTAKCLTPPYFDELFIAFLGLSL